MNEMNQEDSLPTTGRTARVLIVDDHPIVRQGLAQLLEQEEDLTVCGEASSAQSALEAIDRLEPNIVIVDILLKDINGIELIKMIKSQFGKMPVLVMSMHDESLYAERSLRAGARGYIMKEEATDKMLTAIRKVMAGDIYLSERMVSRILHRLAEGKDEAESPLDRLSDRELEVFQLVGEGSSTRQIAERLNVSIKTVESYRAHIKEKLELASSTELVTQAVHWVQLGSKSLEGNSDQE
jgi:DNA-binding NarL/FixJ family response regulator